MIYNQNRYLEELDIPVLGTLFLTATSKSEEAIKELSDAMGRSTRSLTAAARSRLARKKLSPIIKKALMEGLYAACGADTSNCENRLKEEALKSSIRSDLQAA